VVIVSDFDGTIVDRDACDAVAEHFAPEVFAGTSARYLAGELRMNEAVALQYEAVTARQPEALRALRSLVELRPGAQDLVRFAAERFVPFTIVSAGFRQLIEPFVEELGYPVAVIANEVTFTPEGAVCTFRSSRDCDVCGDQCKREATMRAAAGRPVWYVGDGFSDHCAADWVIASGGVVFGRDGLLAHLRAAGLPCTPWDELHDVRFEIARYLQPC
jgi:2-hydroxy-3-keto-5-methylthiopentenyl-1-phosphate phosphatase